MHPSPVSNGSKKLSSSNAAYQPAMSEHSVHTSLHEVHTNGELKYVVPNRARLGTYPVLKSTEPEVREDGEVVVSVKENLAQSSPTPLMTRHDFLQKTSLEYIAYTLLLIGGCSYVLGYDLMMVSRRYIRDLRDNIQPPWLVYRWLGSKGVDMTDSQWSVFIISLPPFLPFLVLFLFLSRHMRRRYALDVEDGFGIDGTTSLPSASNTYITTSSSSASTMGPGVVSVRMVADDPAEGTGLEVSMPTVVTASSPTRRLSLSTPHIATNNSVSHSITVSGANETMSSARNGSPQRRVFASPDRIYVRQGIARLHWLHIIFGMIIAVGLCGPAFFFAIVLILINFYCIAPLHHHLSFHWCMTIMWSWQVATLFLNYFADGYKFAWFGLGALDSLSWPIFNWVTQHNMSVLRMIAYNNDYWEAYSHGAETRQRVLRQHDTRCLDCAIIRDANQHLPALPPESLRCYKCRTGCPRPIDEYSLVSYLGYMLYPPLWVAGPMMSFNAYVSYIRHPTRAIVGKAVWRYGLRYLLNAFVLATMMHYIYIMALVLTKPEPGVSSSSEAAVPVLQRLLFSQRCALMFMTLAFLWSKFNTIWKFFRFFALLDGIDPPEDMRRCFVNTVNIQGFWRDWHASFNLWIVRYMYIPMGGNRRKFLSIFPIFLFIAIWHDIQLRLLYWAMFIWVGFVPEILITRFFASKRNPYVLAIKRRKRLWRFIRMVGCEFGMLELLTINLIGFSIGEKGAMQAIHDLFNEITPKIFTIIILWHFFAAGVAIQDRDQERYNTQQLKLKLNLPLN